jgi:hypothetical protein
VLAVVEADQQPAIPQVKGQCPQRPAHRLDHDPGGGGRQFRHKRRIGDGTEVHPPHPVGPAVGQPRRRLDRQAGLAATTRPGERHHSLRSQQPFDRGQLVAAPDEAGERARQVVGQHIQRAERREVAGQVSMPQLEDAVGCRQVAQPVGAQIP